MDRPTVEASHGTALHKSSEIPADLLNEAKASPALVNELHQFA